MRGVGCSAALPSLGTARTRPLVGSALAVGQEHELAPRPRALQEFVGANDPLERQALSDDGSDAAFCEQPEQQG